MYINNLRLYSKTLIKYFKKEDTPIQSYKWAPKYMSMYKMLTSVGIFKNTTLKELPHIKCLSILTNLSYLISSFGPVGEHLITDHEIQGSNPVSLCLTLEKMEEKKALHLDCPDLGRINWKVLNLNHATFQLQKSNISF